MDRVSPIGRRDMMAGLAAGLAVRTSAQAAGPHSAADATETARGRVFDESDSGRPGIPGVMVSNGTDVALSDAEGHWSLPVAPGQSLFVIKPRGWMTPVDRSTNLPRFAYLHSPHGSPPELGFRFHGISPTGPLPPSIDFPLRRQDESGAFEAVLFTDPQPESLAEVGYIRDDVVAQAIRREARFGITHGDVMFDDLSFYGRYNRIVGSVGLPWYNCCGNHDMNLEAPDNDHSRDTFKRVFGTRWHAFQYGNATFFVLDNVEYLGTDRSKRNGYGKYRGFFGDRQLAFIRNVLVHVPSDQLVVLSFHIPLRTLVGTDPSVASVDTREFLAAISTHPNSVSFSGHTHTNEHWYFGAGDGFADGTHHHHVLAAVSGSWWSGPFDPRGIPMALEGDGSPNGFHILSVDGARYTTTLVPAHDCARGQMRIMVESQLHGEDPEIARDYHPGALLGGPISAELAQASRVLVNVFDGGPRSTVMLAVGEDEFAPMQRIERIDPFVQETYERNASTRKPWVQAGQSSHVWQAALPPDLQPGTYRLTVRATDEYGRPHEASMVLEVTS